MPLAPIARPHPRRRAVGYAIITIPVALFLGVLLILVLGFVYDAPGERAARPVITNLVGVVALLLFVGATLLTIGGVAVAYAGHWMSRRRSVIVPGTVSQVWVDYRWRGIVHRSARVVLSPGPVADRELVVVLPRRAEVGETVRVRVDPRHPKRASVVDHSIVGVIVIIVGAFWELVVVGLIVGIFVLVCGVAVSLVTHLI
jgi:hypothetical protein